MKSDSIAPTGGEHTGRGKTYVEVTLGIFVIESVRSTLKASNSPRRRNPRRITGSGRWAKQRGRTWNGPVIDRYMQ